MSRRPRDPCQNSREGRRSFGRGPGRMEALGPRDVRSGRALPKSPLPQPRAYPAMLPGRPSSRRRRIVATEARTRRPLDSAQISFAICLSEWLAAWSLRTSSRSNRSRGLPRLLRGGSLPSFSSADTGPSGGGVRGGSCGESFSFLPSVRSRPGVPLPAFFDILSISTSSNVSTCAGECRAVVVTLPSYHGSRERYSWCRPPGCRIGVRPAPEESGPGPGPGAVRRGPSQPRGRGPATGTIVMLAGGGPISDRGVPAREHLDKKATTDHQDRPPFPAEPARDPVDPGRESPGATPVEGPKHPSMVTSSSFPAALRARRAGKTTAPPREGR